MKVLGNDVHIQRGETWSLDLDVTNDSGDPYMIFKGWKNPYLAITVTAALYEQKGDFRRTYWLDLDRRWVEKEDGSVVLEPIKKFISTEALNISEFSTNEVLANYGVAVGGRIVLDGESDFDITNYLFFTAEEDDIRTYKYVKNYTLDDNGDIINEVWEEYNFRFIKQFDTKDWTEQGYLFDMKLLTGETVEEHIYDVLIKEGKIIAELPWSSEQIKEYINIINNEETRNYVKELYESGVPLMPDYDTKALILNPTKLYVSVNIQGGIK